MCRTLGFGPDTFSYLKPDTDDPHTSPNTASHTAPDTALYTQTDIPYRTAAGVLMPHSDCSTKTKFSGQVWSVKVLDVY